VPEHRDQGLPDTVGLARYGRAWAFPDLLGAEVIAVEPDPAMLTELRHALS
jgi:hypothetical protein